MVLQTSLFPRVFYKVYTYVDVLCASEGKSRKEGVFPHQCVSQGQRL